MKTTYDEIIKQSCDKLAQTMSDMTYCYEETNVPKKHYKKLLSKSIEEVYADSVSLEMTNNYYKMLLSLNKGNRQWFVEAMLYIELGTAPDKAGVEVNGKVSRMADAIIAQKASMIDPKILDAVAPTPTR
ncbi:hypothetical protein [Lacticaseibacillus paracasei]|uniref:hypothetical protein n=1 Tax=Lacticaseibacillus paracasei TaxID=1597 RepID=UPI00019C9AE3|nr:hypothetical protein [Lacticaseibacillus paracasei]EPC45130.1 hypothetical protein Lpp219_09207 [Lacticaseibacillus paracasei subsp. paracasei Lpp219]EEI68483.1 hypothetical protein HMPREF0530_1325 [Lacticaseibacillus paracasei subsp. paracasei ATCC 25302 = DSM 5622 = JCM 8130]KRM66612.1 hypothetical protein FC74_GL002734 [Lacticaseibacillus paracasei subsp. paracasei ATCC 25302 = DSM 5622 = JCM 8130]MBA4473701.1 hypothetical protein [Lacticaseibacillus paracasei]MCU6431705.1 hypothetical p